MNKVFYNTDVREVFMKKLFLMMLCLFVVSFACAQDLVEGYWKSVDESGVITAGWKIYQKEGKLYGEIVKVPGTDADALATECKGPYKNFPIKGDTSKMTLINTPWIFGLEKISQGVWAGGNIVDPNDGNMYKCKITFRAKDGKKYKEDTLEMRGEIGLGIGRSQFWTKTSLEEISNL